MLGFSENTIKELIAYSLRDADGWHITRFSMYRTLGGILSSYDEKGKECLAISNSAWFGKILGLRNCTYIEANYPEHNILDLKFDDGMFDFCISDQVMEHIEGNPFTAFGESARVVKPGGVICHTTCFINEVHGVPKDFWRFTPDALSLLAKKAGCEVLEAGGWGNREAWALIHAGFRMSRIPQDETHPLHKLAIRNEPNWPIVTWVVGRKL